MTQSSMVEGSKYLKINLVVIVVAAVVAVVEVLVEELVDPGLALEVNTLALGRDRAKDQPFLTLDHDLDHQYYEIEPKHHDLVVHLAHQLDVRLHSDLALDRVRVHDLEKVLCKRKLHLDRALIPNLARTMKTARQNGNPDLARDQPQPLGLKIVTLITIITTTTTTDIVIKSPVVIMGIHRDQPLRARDLLRRIPIMKDHPHRPVVRQKERILVKIAEYHRIVYCNCYYTQNQQPYYFYYPNNNQTITVISTSFNNVLDTMLYTKINNIKKVVVGLF